MSFNQPQRPTRGGLRLYNRYGPFRTPDSQREAIALVDYMQRMQSVRDRRELKLPIGELEARLSTGFKSATDLDAPLSHADGVQALLTLPLAAGSLAGLAAEGISFVATVGIDEALQRLNDPKAIGLNMPMRAEPKSGFASAVYIRCVDKKVCDYAGITVDIAGRTGAHRRVLDPMKTGLDVGLEELQLGSLNRSEASSVEEALIARGALFFSSSYSNERRSVRRGTDGYAGALIYGYAKLAAAGYSEAYS